jgi:hypothetical protein
LRWALGGPLKIGKSFLRIASALLAIFLSLFALLLYAEYANYEDAKKFCNSLNLEMSLEMLETVAQAEDFEVHLSSPDQYGRVWGPGSCGCFILIQNGVLKDKKAAICTD